MNLLKIAALSFSMSGCITYSPSNTGVQYQIDWLKKDLNQLRESYAGHSSAVNKKFTQMEYFIEHDKCFISYGICLGEAKHSKKECWATHERCVILTHQKWKDFLK